MRWQRTLRSSIEATGVGLHAGERVHLALKPAEPHTGIVFHRVDLTPPVSIRVDPFSINDTRLSSTLVVEGVRVATIEHLMAALAALGIDNLHIELSASETPIMDGSAAPFLYLFETAGIVEQPALKTFIRVLKTIRVEEGDKWVQLSPHEGYSIDLGIQFNHPAFFAVPQRIQIDFEQISFLSAISRARTFGFMHEVEYMRAHQLGLGGSMENAIVLNDYTVLNAEGLRYEDEFVRHKILDAVGDLYIVGHPLIAAFSGFKSGHAMNNRLLRTLLEDETAWEKVQFSTDAEVPKAFHPLPSSF